MSSILTRCLCGVAALVWTMPLMSHAAETAEQVVNVYSARHYDSDQTLYDAFTKATGIKVNLVEAKAEGLVERLKAEGKTTPADVLITTDAGNLWRAEHEGLLQPLHDKVLEDAVPAPLRHPDGLWFGLSKRARVFIVPKDADFTPPKTYMELADPKWKGKICIRSSGNVYNQSMLGAMIAHYGVDATRQWVKGLVANMARPPEGGDVDQIKAVIAGECEVAISNHYYYARRLADTEESVRRKAGKVRLVFPDQGDKDNGAHMNISGAGIVKNAPHLDAARKFMEFMVSDTAQNLFAQGAMEYPVKEGVALHPVLTGFGPFKPDPLNVSTFGAHNAEALMIADKEGWK